MESRTQALVHAQPYKNFLKTIKLPPLMVVYIYPLLALKLIPLLLHLCQQQKKRFFFFWVFFYRKETKGVKGHFYFSTKEKDRHWCLMEKRKEFFFSFFNSLSLLWLDDIKSLYFWKLVCIVTYISISAPNASNM